MTKKRTVCRYSRIAMKIHDVVIVLSPVSPTTRQASTKRKIAQKVAPGDSMNLTNIDLFILFHSMNIAPNHITAKIRFRGKAMKLTGKFPTMNCSSMERRR